MKKIAPRPGMKLFTLTIDGTQTQKGARHFTSAIYQTPTTATENGKQIIRYDVWVRPSDVDEYLEEIGQNNAVISVVAQEI